MAASAAIKKKVQKLREQIAEMDRLYYQVNRPAMADMEYDFLKKELEGLEEAHPELKSAQSPTQKVGSDLTGAETIKHKMAMLSLENSYNREELGDFDSRLRRALKLSETLESLEYVVEPKIDGLGINVLYEKGTLVYALTRGDGEEGENVTANFLTIAGVPRELKNWPGGAPESVEIRGEVYMTYAQFEKINSERAEEGLELYANPRNLAAGSLKLKDNAAAAAARGLKVIFYALGDCVMDSSGPSASPAGIVDSTGSPPAAHSGLRPALLENKRIETHEELLLAFKKCGVPTQEKYWKVKGIEACWKAIEELDGLRKNFNYPTDGAVIKLNDHALRTTAGFTARSPRWAFAYKYLPERAETKLKSITIQVGRTGVLTPVAELEGVELSGSVVARATLHNADEIARKDIREGDTVIIEKAGEVIPAVVNVVLEKRPQGSVAYEFPRQCPACGGLVLRAEGEVAQRCVNPDCPAQRKRSLEHFASRNAMAIDGLGEAVVEQLVDKNLVRTVEDVYRLTLKELLELEGFAEKSALNLHAAIQKSKANDLWRLIHGLGIPQVGETVSQLLAQEFETLSALRGAKQERLQEVGGIGSSMAESVVKFFEEPRAIKILEELLRAGVNMNCLTKKPAGEGKLLGKKFVLTGTLKNYTRSAAKEKLEALGGKVVDKVSKAVDFVIAGEEAGSKLAEARKLGVVILEEAGFEKLMSS